MIFNFRRRAIKSQTSRIPLLFLLYFLIFLACAQLLHEKNVSDAENIDKCGKSGKKKSQIKISFRPLESCGYYFRKSIQPYSKEHSYSTTKVTNKSLFDTLNSSSIIYSLTIIALLIICKETYFLTDTQSICTYHEITNKSLFDIFPTLTILLQSFNNCFFITYSFQRVIIWNHSQ